VTGTATVAPPASPATPEAAPRHSWLAVVVPLAVLAIAAGFIVDAGRGSTFFYDEWVWIMHRRSPGEASLLEPFNNHLMALPIVTYQVLERVVGLGSQAPYRLVVLVGHLATCGLLYVYLRRRVGWVLGLCGAAVFAFFGYAWPVIIWPISIGWVYATTAGVGALLLVDRDTRRADLGAAAALLVGVLSSGIAVPFVLGLTVELALRRAWRRIYVPGVALVVFGIWYLAYGTGTNDRGTVGQILRFGEKLLAQTFGTLIGVDDRGTAAHVVLAVVAVALVALWLAVGRPHTPRLVGNTVALVAFTALLSYSRATSGLTQWHSYAAAVFVLLVLGELLAGRNIAVVPTIVVAVVVLWSIVWNLGELGDGADLQRFRAEEMRAQLAAVELAGPAMNPDYDVGPLLVATKAGPYLEVAEEYGSPAYSLAELRRAPAHARRAADVALVDGTGVRVDRRRVPSLVCEPLVPQRTGEVVVRDPDPSLLVAASDGPATLYAGAAGGRGARVGTVPSGTAAGFRAPALRGRVPWTVRVTTDGSVAVCRTDRRSVRVSP
jgi:hypothetical protein